jgi:hypothetical protein
MIDDNEKYLIYKDLSNINDNNIEFNIEQMKSKR